MRIKKAAEKYGISKSTRYTWYYEKKLKKESGNEILSEKDEATLVERLIMCAE